MPINTTSYFAGVGTAFAAIALGFAGGFTVSNPTQKVEAPNRLERVAASAPLSNPPSVQAAAASVQKPDAPAPVPPSTTTESAPLPQPAAAPQPVVAQQQPPPAQEQSGQQPAAAPVPVVAKDDAADQAKIREADLRAAERRRAHRKWAERQRHQQELDAATSQVRQIDRGEGDRVVVQRDPMAMPPRFGLFGNDD